jgi:hypothetical protein
VATISWSVKATILVTNFAFLEGTEENNTAIDLGWCIIWYLEGEGVYISHSLAKNSICRSGLGNWVRHIALANQIGRGNECGIIFCFMWKLISDLPMPIVIMARHRSVNMFTWLHRAIRGKEMLRCTRTGLVEALAEAGSAQLATRQWKFEDWEKNGNCPSAAQLQLDAVVEKSPWELHGVAHLEDRTRLSILSNTPPAWQETKSN